MRHRYRDYDDNPFDTNGKLVPAMLMGAVLGAVAVLLMKPENRDRVAQTYHDIKHKGEELLHTAEDEAEGVAEDVRRRARRVT
jgi:gas vesicle protein